MKLVQVNAECKCPACHKHGLVKGQIGYWFCNLCRARFKEEE